MNTDFTEIVQAAQNGDQRAFEALYNLTKDSSYFVAFSITKNENDALDIMQDSYLKAFNNINDLNQLSAFESWINRIVANTAKNYIAKKKPMLFDDIGTLSNEAFDETELNRDYLPEQSADSKETSRLLMEIIDRLSEEKRLCILMYYYQEMSVGEIAEALQLPVSTVKYKLLAARADIKKEVEKLEKDGTKLYALFPFALFPAQFKNLEKEFAANHTAPAYGAVHSGAIVSDISAAAAISTAKTGFLSTLAGKIVIAVIAIILIGGGIIAAIVAVNSNSESDTTKGTEPTASVSEVAPTTSVSQVTPTSTNTDLLTTEQAIEKMKSVGTDEATFVLDGTVYTLPCSLQEFLDNGWVIGGSEAHLYETGNLWPGNVWDYALIRSDGAHPDCRIIAYLKNTGQERADMKDCDVNSIRMEMHILPPEQDNSELILSGGLLFDSAVINEAVIGACGTPDEQRNIVFSTTRLPDVDTYYTEFNYPTMEINVNSEPNDASKYNYHFCRIFAKTEGEE